MPMGVANVIIMAGGIIMMLIDIKSMNSTKATIAKNVIVNVAKNLNFMLGIGRTDKIIFR